MTLESDSGFGPSNADNKRRTVVEIWDRESSRGGDIKKMYSKVGHTSPAFQTVKGDTVEPYCDATL